MGPRKINYYKWRGGGGGQDRKFLLKGKKNNQKSQTQMPIGFRQLILVKEISLSWIK